MELVEFITVRHTEREQEARQLYATAKANAWKDVERLCLRALLSIQAERRIVADQWGGPDHQDMWEHHAKLLAWADRDDPRYDLAWLPDGQGR